MTNWDVLRMRRGAMLIALLAGCGRPTDTTTASPPTAGPSASEAPSSKSYPPPRPDDAIGGLFAIAAAKSEAVRRDLAAQIAKAKTPAEVDRLTMTARLNADALPTEATVRRGRIVLRRLDKVLLDRVHIRRRHYHAAELTVAV